MSVESATYISQLDATLPGINDPKSEGDDHLRLTKSVLKAQFPNLGAAAVTPTAADINVLAGAATGPIAALQVVTQPATDSSTKAASTAQVQAAIAAATLNSALPSQTGQTGKLLMTNGASVGWSYPLTTRSARTSNTALAASDMSSLIDITSGTFTQTFTAAATLGAGWWCYIRNSGTGDVTLDPSGSELIDGLTSYVMYPGEVRLVQCDGAQFVTVVLTPFSRTFTASGTFITPPGYSQFAGLLWGGGASGNAGPTSLSLRACGGGGGACVPFALKASALGASQAVTIASAASYSAGQPTAGGNSSIGSLVTAYGGGVGGDNGGGTYYGGSGGGAFSAGSATPSLTGGGAPAVAAGYDNPGFGGANGSAGAGYGAFYGGGGGSRAFSGGLALNGGQSMYGGGGGGGAGYSGLSGSGGVSVFGGSGGAGSTSSSGQPGDAPGGGGGGGFTTGGSGARGELRIWGVA